MLEAPETLNRLSTLLCGFTIFSAFILMLAYACFMPQMRKSVFGKISCVLLLAVFILLQIFHTSYFLGDTNPLEESRYLYLLLAAPLLFFCFSQTVIFSDRVWSWIDLVHLLPMFVGLLLPKQTITTYAFVVGTGYTLWMVLRVYELRIESRRFKFEIFFFALFALMAISALILGLSIPYIPQSYFYLAYSNSISFAFLLVVAALIIFPDITQDLIDAVDKAYAQTRLKDVDVVTKVKQINQLMNDDKIFLEESLDLNRLADLVELSSHQLSELINTEFSMGFPKYIRHLRVEEAKKVLVEEPDASVLAVSMMTGFRSQSSFYTAFHEVTGQSPGSYRKGLIKG